jgi:NAD(P)-dependent dehydrogenase (short-subunit alcohol dehydrogenase family)
LERVSEDIGRLDGKVALVTGGSRGIGKAVALALACRGADVAVLARTSEAADPVAAVVRERGRRAVAAGGDVRRWEDVEHLVATVRGSMGSIDVLINNAGTGGAHGYVWDLAPEAFQTALLVNVLGPFLFMKAILPEMIGRGSGVVINVSSGNVRNPGPARSLYGTTKSGLDYLPRAAHQEVAPHGVRVHAFYPGPTDTDMQAELRSDPALPAEIRAQLQARHAEGRLFRPEQPAHGMAWLASPAGAAWTDSICPWSNADVRAQTRELARVRLKRGSRCPPDDRAGGVCEVSSDLHRRPPHAADCRVAGTDGSPALSGKRAAQD